MKSKKGFLLAEETIKMVIAVIGLVILAYFLVSIYFNYSASKDLEVAKSSLNRLNTEINSQVSESRIDNPISFKKWYLLSWDKNSSPKACSNLGFENCICICQLGYFSESLEEFSEDCDNSGYCVESSKKITINSESGIKIENPPVNLKLEYSEGEIKINRI